MRLVCLGDTHGLHALWLQARQRLGLPLAVLGGERVPFEGDVLVHVGDWSSPSMRDWREELAALAAFVRPFGFAHVLLVPGNHDLGLEKAQREEAEAAFGATPATLLRDEAAVVGGRTIFGSPWTRGHTGRSMDRRSFIYAAGDEPWAALRDCPDAIDVLVTHMPAHGLVDASWTGRSLGSRGLRELVDRLDPPLHLCGHVHEAHGVATRGGSVSANVSVVNKLYLPTRPALAFDL